MKRTEILKKNYVVDTVCSRVLWPSCHEHARALNSSSSSSTATLSSTRATLDSSSTRTSIVDVLVLLRTVRAALQRMCMMSRFPRLWLHRNKKDTGPQSFDCSSATSMRQTRARRGQAVTSTRTLSTTTTTNTINTQRHSSNTRLEQHSYACCCCCSTVLLPRTAQA